MNKKISFMNTFGLFVSSTFLAFSVWLIIYILFNEFFIAVFAGFIVGMLSGLVQFALSPGVKRNGEIHWIVEKADE